MSKHETEFAGGMSAPRIGESLLSKKGLGRLLWSEHERKSDEVHEGILSTLPPTLV